MTQVRDRLVMSVTGQFALAASCGADLTPSAAKAQGLLALLAAAPDMRRARSWLRDHLWSDRSAPQGLASLRQCLTDIRRALGDHADHLVTEGKMVALVDVEIRGTPGPDYLESLDVRDPAFDLWLNSARGAPSSVGGSGLPVALAPRNRCVVALAQTEGNNLDAMVSDLMTATIAQSMSETLDVQTVMHAPETVDENTLFLSIRSLMERHSARVRVTWESGTRHRFLWSGTRIVETAGAAPSDHQDILQLANEAVEVLAETILREQRRTGSPEVADSLCRQAMRLIFSMNPDNFAAADDRLVQAFAMDPRGIFPAWRSLLRMIQSIERHDDLSSTLSAEAVALADEAMEIDPMNSMVLAAAANTKLMVSGQLEGGCDLAERAVRINPANPFAWDALSIGALHVGQVRRAHLYMLKAQRIGANSPFKYWWDMGCCLTATMAGDHDTARSCAMTAHALAPDFRPPLRYLIALHAASGELDQAHAAARRLRGMEAGFTIDRMFQDAAYPVAALRKSRLDFDHLRTVLA